MRFIGRQELLLKLLASLFAKEITSKPANLPLACGEIIITLAIFAKCLFKHATNEKKALLGEPTATGFQQGF